MVHSVYIYGLFCTASAILFHFVMSPIVQGAFNINCV